MQLSQLPSRLRTAFAIAAGGFAFVVLALAHARRLNVDMSRYDQDSYLAYAVSQAESGFTALGTRRQMPVYPMLLALFHRAGEPLGAFFERAKLVNVALTALLSLGLVFLLARLLPRREARNLSLVAVFFVFAFRAPYVQVEALSYAAIFVQFLLLCRLWSRPSLVVAALAGAASAFAFLSKGTALLGLYVFIACAMAREIVRASSRRAAREALARAATALVVPLVFAAAIAPYARNSKAAYGSYLFDMSTRYVMWCDSWEEFSALNGKYGFWMGWGALPQAQLPSMANYFATHSLGQIVAREIGGLGEVVGNCLISHGYAPFFLLLAAFAVALVAQNASLRTTVFRWRDPDWIGWFVLPYLAAHLLTYGFYGPIGAGNRFSLSMFLPSIYAITRAFAGRATPEHRVAIGRATLDWDGFQSLLFAFALLELATYWPAAMVAHYAAG